MYIKTVTYNDYFGVERTEELRFNLTKTEILEMQLSIDGGMTAYYEQIKAQMKIPALLDETRKLILSAYGRVSADGRRFEKKQEFTDDFVQSGAYDAFMFEIYTNPEAQKEFILQVLPQDVAAEIDFDNPKNNLVG